MKKLIILFLTILVSGCSLTKPSSEVIPAENLSLINFTNDKQENIPLAVEVANTPQKLTLGLMHRKSLAKDHGMIFIFDKPDKYAFWMKNTLIPLEMIFVSKNKSIVDIIHASPCEKDPCVSYTPKDKALYVIEVNEGYSSENNLAIGNYVNLGDIV